MKRIIPRKIRNQEVTIPGSKSLTHRALICAALAPGTSTIINPLMSEDTKLTMATLGMMGAKIASGKNKTTIKGVNGSPSACGTPIFLGNSGTSMRLLTGVAAIGKGKYLLTGNERMHKRPVQPLVDALTDLGIDCMCKNNDGCPPVVVKGGEPSKKSVFIDCSLSSQFLSSILLIGPCTKKGLEISTSAQPVSRPYIDITLDIMSSFGVKVEREGYRKFRVPGGRGYISTQLTIEPDISHASYFWAAAAICGARVTVRGLSSNSSQGDIGFLRVLQDMGCKTETREEGIAVTGGRLSGIFVDMKDMPDLVPTLAVIAAFAEGRTRICNIRHLREKESDRIGSTSENLKRLGADVRCGEDYIEIYPGKLKPSVIDPHDDHRIAMSFAIAGLRVEGIMIKNPGCVGKSFPSFWDVFEGMKAD